MTRGLVTLGLILTITGVLSAVDKPSPEAADQAKAMAELQQKLLRQFDLNQDGVLSPAEKLAAQEAMAKQGLPAAGMPPGGSGGIDQFLKRFDKNGDGKLDDAEKLAAQAAWNKLRGDAKLGGGSGPQFGPQGGGPAVVPGPVDPKVKADSKDNKVNPLVKRFDKDGDGKLNDDEKATAQAALKKKKEKDKDPM